MQIFLFMGGTSLSVSNVYHYKATKIGKCKINSKIAHQNNFIEFLLRFNHDPNTNIPEQSKCVIEIFFSANENDSYNFDYSSAIVLNIMK